MHKGVEICEERGKTNYKLYKKLQIILSPEKMVHHFCWILHYFGIMWKSKDSILMQEDKLSFKVYLSHTLSHFILSHKTTKF